MFWKLAEAGLVYRGNVALSPRVLGMASSRGTSRVAVAWPDRYETPGPLALVLASARLGQNRRFPRRRRRGQPWWLHFWNRDRALAWPIPVHACHRDDD